MSVSSRADTSASDVLELQQGCQRTWPDRDPHGQGDRRRRRDRLPRRALAIKITRRGRAVGSTRWRTQTVYAITDLGYDQTHPGELADIIRAHWGIENRLHWIRDVTFSEDLSQTRTSHGPAVMATLRNLAISLHRSAGATNIADACRHLNRDPSRVLPLLR